MRERQTTKQRGAAAAATAAGYQSGFGKMRGLPVGASCDTPGLLGLCRLVMVFWAGQGELVVDSWVRECWAVVGWQRDPPGK